LILTGYFDESERDSEGEPICVAGYLFKPTGYKHFRKKWQRDVLAFGERRFRHFHMTDLCAGHGEYAGLPICDRVEILNGAVSAISKHTYASIAVHFDKAEFVKVAPPEWPAYRGSIYTAACHMCIQSSAHWLEKWGCHADVLYVFERGHKFQGEVEAVLKSIAANDEARALFRYGNHIFEKKSEVGLQAADLQAWTITKARACGGGTVPKAFRPFVQPILRLANGASNGRNLLHQLTGDRLRRFVAEQLAVPEGGIPVDFGPGKRGF
jgi:hypothetical protein